MYLLDTCLISELVKLKPEQNVTDWLNSCEEDVLFISVMTLGELQKGIVKLADGQRKTSLQQWISNDLVRRFRGRILSIDSSITLLWGEILAEAEKRGKKLPVIDTLIAATAITHNLTVVTRNIPDIIESGAKTFNPWNK